MELKKSPQSDINRRRSTMFLLALVFILASVFVAFEWTSTPSVPVNLDALMDNVMPDLDLISPLEHEEEYTETQINHPEDLNKPLQAVEQQVEIPDITQPTSSELLIGDGEGIADDTQIEEALPPVTLADSRPVLFNQTDKIPEFPGGMSKFVAYLTQNLRYPVQAKNAHKEGRVIVSFVVNTDGSVSDAKLEHSVNPMLDQEAMRVIASMPLWKPGEMGGKPCRTLLAIPIVFKL